MTTILVADDQAMVRMAIATTLALEPDLDVVGQAGDCAEAIRIAGETRPDVLLLDVQMPAGGVGVEDGIDAIPAILAVSPSTKILVVTTFGRPGYLRRALEQGAIGFMVKDAPADELIEGVRRAAAGLRVVDSDLAVASLSVGASPLTEKEADVLAAASGGASTREIAARVHLSEGTVRNYLSSAIGKMGAHNRAEAVQLAEDNGWL